jgi:hypothetical protein
MEGSRTLLTNVDLTAFFNVGEQDVHADPTQFNARVPSCRDV